MKNLFVLGLAALVTTFFSSNVEAGLKHCRAAKSTCCEPAPVACCPAPAPVCCPIPVVVCKPVVVCCPTPAPVCKPVCCDPAPVASCCKPKHQPVRNLLKKLKSRQCCEASAPCCNCATSEAYTVTVGSPEPEVAPKTVVMPAPAL